MRRRDEADEGKRFVSWCVCVISASEAVRSSNKRP